MAQELSTKMMQPLSDKEQVRPFDVVTVYATSKANFHKEGDALEVHPLLAAKLIASGKATDKLKAEKK